MSVYVERALLVMAWVLAAAVGISLVLVMHGCDGARPARYATEVTLCETATTCAGYVTCRSQVEARYNHVWAAECRDGGAP